MAIKPFYTLPGELIREVGVELECEVFDIVLVAVSVPLKLCLNKPSQA